MTRQTWTALLAAVVFVVLAATIALVPAPYVTWSPGDTVNTLGQVDGRPVISVRGVDDYQTDGELDLTTVRITRPDSWLSLPEAVSAYWLPDRDALPREWIYPLGTTATAVRQTEQRQMSLAQQDAVVAALRAAQIPVQPVLAVDSVTAGFAADGLLREGDLLLSMDGVQLPRSDVFTAELRKHTPGDVVTLAISRDRQIRDVRLVVKSSLVQDGIPVLGFVVGNGYVYEPVIEFSVDDLGGPSAGLIFALAIYDKVTPGALLDGRHVAGTGEIDANGVVGSIGGIQQKIAAAEDSGAEVFLVPGANCADLAGVRTAMRLVRVDRLDDAVSALRQLAADPDRALPQC